MIIHFLLIVKGFFRIFSFLCNSSTISFEDTAETNFSLKYNQELAGEYLRYLQQMADQFGLENDIRVSTLSRYPEVFTMEEEAVVINDTEDSDIPSFFKSR